MRISCVTSQLKDGFTIFEHQIGMSLFESVEFAERLVNANNVGPNAESVYYF
jgi:hypothetical protein